MKIRYAIGALGAGLMLAVAAANPAMAADNLVENGGFDGAGYNSNGGVFPVGSQFDGWTMVTASSGGAPVQVWWAGMGSPGIDYAAPFPEGPWIRIMGTIEQSIPTEVGKTYLLEYKTRASGAGANEFAVGWAGGRQGGVSIDGVAVDAFTTVVTPLYSPRSVVFTATSTSTALAFYNTDGGAVGVDSVSVTLVPENESPVMGAAIVGGVSVAAVAAGSALFIQRRNKRASA